MKCAQFRQLLDAYLDNELSPALRLEFDTHRVQCEDCQRWLTMVEAVTNTVSNDTDVPALSGNFTDRVLAATTASESPRPRLVTWRLWTVGAAAMQAAAVLAWAILQPLGSTASTQANMNPFAPALAAGIAPVDTGLVQKLDPHHAIATKDTTALTEIIYTQVEQQMRSLEQAGRSVNQLADYLHLSLPVEDDSDVICEVPGLDPFTGLLNAVHVLAEEPSTSDQADSADDGFRL